MKVNCDYFNLTFIGVCDEGCYNCDLVGCWYMSVMMIVV